MNGILATLAELGGPGQDWAMLAWLVFLRVGAAMALLPAFGEQQVPARIRLAAALAFAAIILPAVAPLVAGAAGKGGGRLLASEVAVGLIFGAGFRLMVLALATAGTIAAQAISLSQLFGGTAGEPQPAVASLFTMAGLALAVSMGLHVRLAEALILTYDLLPPGEFPLPGAVADWGIAAVGRSFALAFSLAAPFVIASVIYNVALGVLNRAMPQLMVAFVGAPALTLGGLALLALVAPVLLSVWLDALGRELEHPLGATR